MTMPRLSNPPAPPPPPTCQVEPGEILWKGRPVDYTDPVLCEQIIRYLLADAKVTLGHAQQERAFWASIRR